MSMPMVPPQVLVPTTGPMPSALIAALTMSPSEPENSLATATTGPHRDAGRGQRRACLRVRAVPRQHPGHVPGVVPAFQVGAEQAEPPRPVLAVAGRQHVGVRRA